MQNCILVGIGGFIGTVCRYLIGLVPIGPQNGFPVKTLFINVAGAFLLGLITALASKNEVVHPSVILMLRIGVCGGFTTFSTFAYESVDLIKNGNMAVSLFYMGASVILGALAVFAAQILAK